MEPRLPPPRSMSRCRLALISCPLSPSPPPPVPSAARLRAPRALPRLPGTARLVSRPPSAPLCSSSVLAPASTGAQGLKHGHRGCGPALVPPEKCPSLLGGQCPWGGPWGGAAHIGGHPAAPDTCPRPHVAGTISCRGTPEVACCLCLFSVHAARQEGVGRVCANNYRGGYQTRDELTAQRGSGLRGVLALSAHVCARLQAQRAHSSGAHKDTRAQHCTHVCTLTPRLPGILASSR